MWTNIVWLIGLQLGMAGGAAHLALILAGFTLRDLGLSAGTESGGGLGGSFDMTDQGTLWATTIRSRLTEHLALPARPRLTDTNRVAPQNE